MSNNPTNGDHERLRVENAYKIFGGDPETAFKLIEQGKKKDEIYKETGLTIGVENATFSVYAGEVFVIMGLSGSGKSTLVRLLNRLIEPTSGKIIVEGQDITQMDNKELVEMRRKYMSMVFQSFALMPHLTVLQNAAFGLEIMGIDEKKRQERAMDALKQVGLEHVANSYPEALSGGMKQRVGLARGLAVDPDIMLMDEAFSALDPLIRTEMQDELLKLQEGSNRTVVFISHDLDEAMRIGDRIAMMESGRIVQIGAPEEILRNPADEYVKAFFRGVDPTNVYTAGDIATTTQVTFPMHKAGLRAVRQRLNEYDREHAYIVRRDRTYVGVVSFDSVNAAIEDESIASEDIRPAFLEGIEPVYKDSTLQDILPKLTSYECPVPIVDENNKFFGTISRHLFLKTLTREAEAEEAEDSETEAAAEEA
ncbi:MAG: glycine betaine/L-proline ABC transporter ATP-binding protein ProV [Desulfobacteraceae bacterium]|nr:glycine betaine/L-proline ABC transporter ATP-binding protein ProV [Desulfobacteraceae bacterium]MCF8096083.1 glycine betaine/L-proline ABC transporter ATP-binding protein ProV [Desulfobacteraceae bacterium]